MCCVWVIFCILQVFFHFFVYLLILLPYVKVLIYSLSFSFFSVTTLHEGEPWGFLTIFLTIQVLLSPSSPTFYSFC